MTATLPEGFVPVPTGKRPAVTFDVDFNRFYLSTSLMKEYRMTPRSRVGLSYNRQSRQLLLDKQARSFYVDKRGYITAKQFVDRAYGKSQAKGKDAVKYEVNKDMSDDRFIVFDETEV